MKSKLFSLNRSDIFQSALTAAGSTVAGSLLLYLNAGSLPSMSQLSAIGILGASAFLGSLIKRFSTNSNGKLASEPKV